MVKGLAELHMIWVPTRSMLEGGYVLVSLREGGTWAILLKPMENLCEWMLMACASPSHENKGRMLGECEEFKFKEVPNEGSMLGFLSEPSSDHPLVSMPRPYGLLGDTLEALIRCKKELSMEGKHIAFFGETSNEANAREKTPRTHMHPPALMLRESFQVKAEEYVWKTHGYKRKRSHESRDMGWKKLKVSINGSTSSEVPTWFE